MSKFVVIMNCLTIILKPGFHFNALVEIERFLKRTMPQYSFSFDDGYIDIEPLGVSIIEPFFQEESEEKKFLTIAFYIRDAWVYQDDEYHKIYAIAKEIAIALKTNEWWYSSEMQGDQYDDYTPGQIADFIANGDHVMEYEDYMSGIRGEELWFLHDNIKS